MLYKPAEVTPIGRTGGAQHRRPSSTVVTQDPRNRPALAQAFRDNVTGGVFVGVANHLKSKGSACDSPTRVTGRATATPCATAVGGAAGRLAGN